MIGLDTNVLVRYVARDNAVQSPRATNLIERRLTEAEPGFIGAVAMVETAWVLERAHGLTAGEISKAIESTLQIDVLVVMHEQDVFTALNAMKQGIGSFADALMR